MTLVRGHTIPTNRFTQVFKYAQAPVVHHGQVILAGGETLGGGHPVPAYRLRSVFRHSETTSVHDADVILRARVALLRRLTIPARRFHEISRNASALIVQPAQVVLRPCVTLFRGHAVPPQCLFIVPRHAIPPGIHVPEKDLGIDYAHLGLPVYFAQRGYGLAEGGGRERDNPCHDGQPEQGENEEPLLCKFCHEIPHTGRIIPRTGVDPGSSNYSDRVQDGCSVIPGDNVTREGKRNTRIIQSVSGKGSGLGF